MIYYTIFPTAKFKKAAFKDYEAKTFEKAETELFCYLLELGYEPTQLVKKQINMNTTQLSFTTGETFTITKKFK
jgi:hypothetical protein